MSSPTEVTLSEVGDASRLARDLFTMGMEPEPVVAMLSHVLSEQKVKGIFRSVSTRKVKPGIKPTGQDWWSRNDRHRMHASVFLGCCRQVMGEHQALVDIFLCAYERYMHWSQEGENQTLSATRAYYLLTQFIAKRIVLVRCEQCGCDSLADRWDKFGAQKRCPICALESRAPRIDTENCSKKRLNASIHSIEAVSQSAHAQMAPTLFAKKSATQR